MADAEDGDALVVEVSEQPLDVAFHPREQLVVAATIEGCIELAQFTATAAAAATRHRLHDESCRAVSFDPQGALLLTGSADRSVVAFDVARGKVVARLASAHASGVNRLTFVGDTVLATGDDDGHVKLWDTRERKNVGAWRVHKDFVADLHHAAQHNALISSSGDGALRAAVEPGTVATIDLAAGRVTGRCEDQEDELLSVVLMKRGRKIVCGSQDGVLSIFDWGSIADISDRYPGHPASVDTLVAATDDLLLSGSSDGLIRVIHVLPNRMLGVVGEHSEFPLERLALSADRRWLASASHDTSVKLWDVAYLQEPDAAAGVTDDHAGAPPGGGDGGDEEEEEEEEEPQQKRRRGKKAPKGGKQKPDSRAAFFADLAG